jgi:putative heme iron utilization protein
MKRQFLIEIRELLLAERVLSLGILRDGEPYVGLLPYAPLPNFSGAIIHASRLALHAAGLATGVSFSALIHAPDRPDSDPLQVPRISLHGSVDGIPRDSRDYAVHREFYVRRFPVSTRTFELADFQLYVLRFAGGRYVGGFARARTLGPKDIQALGDVSDV